MEKIIYVTGNYGKYYLVKQQFEEKNIDIDFFEYDFSEPEVNNIELVSKAKALEAYKVLGKPCFAADSGFYIDDYPDNFGYPGAFVKRSGVSSNIENLLEVMKNTDNRACRFVDCLTFYNGKNFYSFLGTSEGALAFEPKGDIVKISKSSLWSVFIPKNCHKTLAEMTDEERKNRKDNRTSATMVFADWYKNQYLPNIAGYNLLLK